MKKLLILGTADCLNEDLEYVELNDFDIFAVNQAGIVRPDINIKALVTYHPYEMLAEGWITQRKDSGGSDGYDIVLNGRCEAAENIYGARIVYAKDTPRPGQSGSSALLAVFHGMALGYQLILLAGCPLDGKYARFRQAWTKNKVFFAGRVRSFSGWTKELLGGV